MKTFDQAWKEKGYNYGDDALEGVKLGWEMAVNAAIEHFDALSMDFSNRRMKDGDSFPKRLDASIKDFSESGNQT